MHLAYSDVEVDYEAGEPSLYVEKMSNRGTYGSACSPDDKQLDTYT